MRSVVSLPPVVVVVLVDGDHGEGVFALGGNVPRAPSLSPMVVVSWWFVVGRSNSNLGGDVLQRPAGPRLGLPCPGLSASLVHVRPIVAR